jgi:hypothetical protein
VRGRAECLPGHLSLNNVLPPSVNPAVIVATTRRVLLSSGLSPSSNSSPLNTTGYQLAAGSEWLKVLHRSAGDLTNPSTVGCPRNGVRRYEGLMLRGSSWVCPAVRRGTDWDMIRGRRGGFASQVRATVQPAWPFMPARTGQGWRSRASRRSLARCGAALFGATSRTASCSPTR